MVEQTNGRRSFINWLLGGGLVGWLASVLYPVSAYLNPPAEADANVASVRWGPANDFPNGGSEILRFGRTPVMVIRTDRGEFRAYAATCTHLDCTVQFRSEKKDLWCACHNGVYDLQGRNVSGPPPRPLESYAIAIVDGDLVVSRNEA